MWPFRPEKLTDLFDPAEIRSLLGFGPELLLKSDITLVEVAGEEPFSRFDPDPALAGARPSTFCRFLRHGEIDGAAAFEGANEACERCEARFARRVLSAGASSVTRSRCHMGLCDVAAPVVVKGSVVAVIIAGQRVESEEHRTKIQKGVGKLGKLTRAEVRSLEEAKAPVVPSIRPQSGRARDLLLASVTKIPLLTSDFEVRLEQFAAMVSRLAEGRFEAFRRARGESLVKKVAHDMQADDSLDRDALLGRLAAVTRTLRDDLGVEFVALFAHPPERVGEGGPALPLLAECGLSPYGRPDLLTDGPILELDIRRLPRGGEGESDWVARSTAAVSSLISAVHSTERSPPDWKDRLTKSLFVPAVLGRRGLELVAAFGAPSESSPAAETDDFFLLWSLTRALAEEYQFSVVEAQRRRLAEEDKKRQAAKVRQEKKPSPIRPQRFNLSKLLEQCLQAVSPQAERRNVSFDAKGLPERIMIEADRPKLKAVCLLLLGYAAENARAGEGEPSASVLVNVRRQRRPRSRVNVVIDLVGEFLDADRRRALFQKPAQRPGRGAPPGTGEASEPAPPEVAAAAASESPGAETAPRPSPPSPDASTPEPLAPVDFREARRYLSWHRGSLHLEAIRTRPVEGQEGAWLGRTIFTVTVPEVQTKSPKPDSPGPSRQRRPARDATERGRPPA